MLAYFGGDQPNSKEEGAAHMKKWHEWIAGLGDTVINPGTPLLASKLVTLNGAEDDSNSKAMNGFAVVQAADMESAVVIAKSDPFLQMNGTLRVSEMMSMQP